MLLLEQSASPEVVCRHRNRRKKWYMASGANTATSTAQATSTQAL
jgi:hypothetical protein